MKHHRSSYNTPLEIYHGVPSGWSKEEIVAKYKALGGKGSIAPEEATEPGAPSWMPDRYNWLQYIATLHKIADGVSDADAVCIELAIQYIELNYFGSYSGFIRERLARLLKSKPLTYEQASRLKRHIQALRDNKECFEEFREYIKLDRRIRYEWPNA